MMTEEQRYLFDLCGFLHLQNVLTPEELDAASDAASRYINSAPEDLPPHFGRSENLKGFAHGFAFDRALEKLVFLPGVWPIVLELTNGKPMLASGTMLVDSPDGHTEAVQLHCARDDYGFESAPLRGAPRPHLLRRLCGVSLPRRGCFPVMVGYSWCRGRTKASFDRPRQLFNQGFIEGEVPPGVVNITPAAGDAVVMPECVTHGVLPWRAPDRQRRVLTLRYRPHHRQAGPIPEAVKERLAPETRELVESAHYTHEKGIATRQRVCLSQDEQ